MDHDNVPYREVTTTRYLYSGKALDALTQRVAALEAERTPQSGPRLCPDCFTVVPVGHQCRVPPTVRVSESGSAPSPAPPAAPSLHGCPNCRCGSV